MRPVHDCTAAAGLFGSRARGQHARPMPIDRRQFVASAAALLASSSALGRAPPRLRAVAFDGLVVFDTRRVLALAESEFPGRGAELVAAWRARQFDYQWLRVSGGRYEDFARVTADSLEVAARAIGVELSAGARAALLGVYRELDAWPDAPPALRALEDAGLRLVLLSNMTPSMLNAGVERAGLGGVFERVLSADDVKSFKPAPRAYALGPSALRLPAESILFVASAGWDAAGAKWFGYPTYWVNRSKAPQEELGAAPDGVGGDLRDLVAFATQR
jgi:2-haloacid dehalogenase